VIDASVFLSTIWETADLGAVDVEGLLERRIVRATDMGAREAVAKLNFAFLLARSREKPSSTACDCQSFSLECV